MKEIDTILNFLSFLRKRIYYADGLIALVIFVGVGYSMAVSNLGAHLSAFMAGCGHPLLSTVKHGVFLLGLLVVELVVIFFWFYHRALPKFRRNELGIIFAPNFPKALDEDVEQLFSHLVHELKSNEFGNHFAVKRLPPNKTIHSHEEATAATRKCRGTVAVWGLMESQISKDGRTTGFSSISFTVVYRPTRVGLGFPRRLAVSMAGKKWHAEERNQIVDRQLLARNIGLVVRNMLGLALMIDRRFRDATKVFLPLCNDLSITIGPKSSMVLHEFYANVRADTASCLTASTDVEYLEYLRSNRLFLIPKSKLDMWLNNVNQAIKLDRQHFGHFLMKAAILFLLGQFPESLEAAKQSHDRASKDEAGPNFSLAFLYNFNGDFERSKKQYRRALNKKTSYEREMIQNILTFIRQAILHFPEKPQLRFALGLLELNRGDPNVGRQLLAQFIGETHAMPNLIEFVEEARRLLSEKADNGQTSTIKESGAKFHP